MMNLSAAIAEDAGALNYNYEDIADKLQHTTVFSACTAQDLARVIPKVTIRFFQQGELLFQGGTPAENLYLLSAGSVKLVSGKRKVKEISSGFVGEEAAVNIPRYMSDGLVEIPAEVLVIPREAIKRLADTNPEVARNFYNSLLDHYKTAEDQPEQAVADTIKRGRLSAGIVKPVGWLLAMIVPASVLIFCTGTDLDWSSRIFAAIFSSVIVMWVFRLSAEFIPCILALLVLVFLGIAPVGVVLSGFTSGSFFMAMSVFGLAVVLVASGVTYRFVLVALKYFPNSRFGYTLSIFLTGFLLTPVFPSANGRVSITTPLLTDLVEALGYKPGGKAATQLAVASFSGLSLFSGAFVSSKAINFVVFGLLPPQVKEQFSWAYWAFASAVFVLVIFLLYMLFSYLMYRNDELPVLSREQLDAQLRILGPPSSKEWAAIAGVLLFFIGIATSSIHKIDTPWIGLVVLYIFLALGTLSKREFQKDINWPFLIYLGGLIGLATTMSYIGLDQWIGTKLLWMGQYMRENFMLFVFLLFILITLVRFAIPNNATVVIFATIFIPIAQISGINPWIIGFIILTLSDGWIMPYQCTYYVQFMEETRHHKIYNQNSMLVFNMLSNFIRLGAVYASIPYWRLLGIL